MSRDLELGNLIFGNSRGKFPVDRDEWEDTFCNFLTKCGFDTYGHIINDELEKYVKTITSKYSNKDIYGEDCKNETIKNNFDYHSHIHIFDNGIFMINPYYWGDAEDLAELPNFIYYPIGYELCWYKYPLRDSWSNQELTFEEFCDIINKCRNSLIEWK